MVSVNGVEVSAMAAAVFARPGPLAFWDRFCQQVESRIRDGNTISGDLLWRTCACAEASLGLSIQNVYRPADRLDCIFDPAKCLLTCTPGPEIPLDACQFQWVGGTMDILRRGAEEFTLSQALILLLDELVWPDD
jgi:hypothetical protein